MNLNLFTVLTDLERRLPLYMTNVGGWDNQDPIKREQGFPDFQWIQTLNGQGMLECEGERHTVSKGQGMLLYPHSPHEYYPLKEPWEVMWIAFNGDQAFSMLASLHFTRTQVLYVSHPDRTLKTIRSALALAQSKDPMRSMECSSLVYGLLLDLFAYGSPSELRSKQQHYEQLAPVISLIEDRYAEELTLDILAERLGVSPQHTCLLFRQTLGMRPFEYITRQRIRKAKELLLQEPDREVKDIAAKVGYSHPSYFIKLFKQHEGLTPAKFRSVYRITE
jgi:AraC family transcriptional regulator of arabinose operon